MDGSDKERALIEVMSGLKLRDGDPELQQFLDRMIRDSEAGAQHAQEAATQAGAQAAAPGSFRAATRLSREAANAEQAGHPARAVRGFWAAAALFGQATEEAKRAAVAARAQPAPSTPQRRGEPGRGASGRDSAPPVASQQPEVVAPEPKVIQPSSPQPGNPAPSETTGAPRPGTPASPARNDEADIRDTLRRFQEANARLDAAAVHRVWPSLGGDQLARMAREFDALKAYDVRIEDPRITVHDQSATVQCRVTRSFTPKAGKPISRNSAMVIQLTRNGNTWVITGLANQ